MSIKNFERENTITKILNNVNAFETIFINRHYYQRICIE